MKLKEIRKVALIVTVLIIGITFTSCQKDEILNILPEQEEEENTTFTSECPPYEIPLIKTEADYGHTVYIDPSAIATGEGTISSPLKTLPSALKENTAYLIKRGTTHPGIRALLNSVLIGAYGQGEQPIITGGLQVQNNSSNSTVRDLDITKKRSGNGDKVLDFFHQNTSKDITIAFCKLRGIPSDGIYPQYAIHHSTEGLILFNNEIFNIQNNGWWISDRPNIKIIRNWIHHVNKGGENSSNSSGDGIQAEYGMTGLYFAGNIIDKSNALWKYALMLNGDQKDNVFEYNTFYAPKAGAGGAGVRWMSGQGGIFRKNLVKSIDDNGQALTGPFDTWDSHANKPAPYGVRDNHILKINGSVSNVSTNSVVLNESNTVFTSNESYQAFLEDNPQAGQYGSDITSSNFWSGACKPALTTHIRDYPPRAMFP